MKCSVPVLCVLIGLVLSPRSLRAQQLINGGFESGVTPWILCDTNRGTFFDIDGDGDLEAVIAATNTPFQYSGYCIFQDFPSAFLDLNYGVALRADICATNMNEDMRAYAKLEFLDETNALIGAATYSGEYDPNTYAVSNQCRLQNVLVKQHRNLVNELAGVGKTINEVSAVRATFFVLRFDNTGNDTTGSGYFDNANLGLVSREYNVPGIVNGNFNYGDWWWRESFVSSDQGWIVADRDGDGDQELEFVAAGLTNQFEGRLWIQEFDARLIDFTQGISLTADFGATNLSSQFRVFTKVEFFTNAPPYSTNVYYALPTPVTLDGATNASLYATNNQTYLGLTLDKSYEALTNELAQIGSEVDAITTVRTVLFLFSFDASPVTIGSGWFDNVHLDFEYKNPPNATAAAKSSGDDAVLSWQSQTDFVYRVQRLHDLSDFKWTNIATGIPGQNGTTSVTNPLTGSNGFLRVVRDP